MFIINRYYKIYNTSHIIKNINNRYYKKYINIIIKIIYDIF
jgi:hypothetical protein